MSDEKIIPVSSSQPAFFNPEQSPTTQLMVPANQRFLRILLGYVHELCSIAGLSDTDLLHFEVASEEAFVNIVEHAYPDCKPGDIYIQGTITPTELVLSFRDEGIPFHESPKEIPYIIDPDADIQSHGLGFQIIRNTVDEVRFENLGKRGKVLVLVKKLPIPVEIELDQEIQDISPAPPQHYEIRPMLPEEASMVCRLFWRVYGYTYKNEDFYRPEGLLHLINSGRVTSYVAVGEDKEVAGHIGLIRPDQIPMAEIGLLVVSPAHRGRRIMEMLDKTISDKAVELGLSGLSFNAVTSHDKSQKGGFHLGFIPCSLDLAACPPRVFKALVSPDTPIQRESYVHAFKYIHNPPPVTIYLPARYHAMVTRVYDNLQQRCIIGEPAPANCPGDFRIHYDRTLQKGEITVITADERQWAEILRVAQDMVEFADAEVVDLDLPLAQPATGLLIEQAESAGFIFTGIRPCQALDGDCARLQKLGVPFDLKNIHIYPGFGEVLLKDIASIMEAIQVVSVKE
ncbi:MAG TPA: GNAT family N-acetyltransferase [Methanospirillum sp.]|nr:GNAT family N-acetyltransferase [Methanospirillum sp.]